MRELLGLGFALIAIGAVMGLLHFAGILIGTTLSWVAGVIFIGGIILAVVGAGQAKARETRT